MAPSVFKVPYRELPTHRRVEVASAFVASALRGLPMREALEPPADDPDAGGGVAELELYADGAHVFAVGSIAGFITVACGRCVAPVRVEIDEPLQVTFVPLAELPDDDDDKPPVVRLGKDGKPKPVKPAPKVAPSDDGVELEADALDVYGYDGDVVDLEPLIREQFILAVPFAPLCSEDCLGLCPQCGADRNRARCGCEKPIDPRFEALKGLKLPS